MEKLPNLSKEFLEKNLGRKVESWTISSGSNVGDNYTSVLYSIDIKLPGDGEYGGETLHLISKCYPNNPVRQKFLSEANIFWNELSIYETLLPSLTKAREKMGLTEKLPFPPLIGGHCPDFDKIQEMGDTTSIEKVYDPFEIYILMTDIRKTWGFQMSDRQQGLDFDHASLVVKAHALLHSTSWAYKQGKKITSLTSEFPFLDFKLLERDGALIKNAMTQGLKLAADTMATKFGTDSALVSGTTRLINYMDIITESLYAPGIANEGLAQMHRLKSPETSNKPWNVVLHGDSWTNNLLFRYDKSTGRPCEVTLVDLQLMREKCPTLDLAYFLYCSTTSEFRKAHLNDVLAIYYHEFLTNCSKMKVEPIPDFTLNELKRRFHESKVCGYACAALILSITLKDTKDVVDVDQVNAENMEEIMQNMTADKTRVNSIYTERICNLAQELYDEGVI